MEAPHTFQELKEKMQNGVSILQITQNRLSHFVFQDNPAFGISDETFDRLKVVMDLKPDRAFTHMGISRREWKIPKPAREFRHGKILPKNGGEA